MARLRLPALLAATVFAVGDRVVERLRGGSGADGNVCHHFGIKRRICVIDNRVVSAAAALGFHADIALQLGLRRGDVALRQRERILRALVVHLLGAQFRPDRLQFTINVLIQLDGLLVGVDVGVAQLDLRFQLCNARGLRAS